MACAQSALMSRLREEGRAALREQRPDEAYA
jgi:hypothetical protein